MAGITSRLAPLRLRRLAAVAIILLALESVVYGLAGPELEGGRGWVLSGGLVPEAPAGARIAALVLGLALLALTPHVWRGTRTALALAITALLALAVLSAEHHRIAVAGLQAGLALTLALARGAFPLGCSNRPRPKIVLAALGAWTLAAAALALAALVARTTGHALAHALRHPVGHALHLAAAAPRLDAGWTSLIEALIGGALAISVLALRSAVSPARADNRPTDHEYRTARAIIDAHGADSLAPFVVRPDKALAFAAGGVLSYRVIGGTAVVSADPVAPGDGAGDVLAGFQTYARERGWQIAVWGASDCHLEAYRRLGLRAICVGEEAFVDPAGFNLEGRAVRKLRQSLHRVARRGWEIDVRDGRDIDPTLEDEIDALAERWRLDHPRLHGFAMSMGAYAGELRPDDLCLLARSPDGDLGAVMRFVMYRGNLSLDTMQRVGATPNGLNEALVVRALEVARERGIAEVSLNYAGLAHLVREEPSGRRWRRALIKMAIAPLHRRFQMDRLVRFNDKFAPQWRPRYLVYESRFALPRTVIRVLQAEGYLPQPRPSALLARMTHVLPQSLPDRPRQRRALSEPR
jgi:lysyl-tRNA synthetase, class II